MQVATWDGSDSSEWCGIVALTASGLPMISKIAVSFWSSVTSSPLYRTGMASIVTQSAVEMYYKAGKFLKAVEKRVSYRISGDEVMHHAPKCARFQDRKVSGVGAATRPTSSMSYTYRTAHAHTMTNNLTCSSLTPPFALQSAHFSLGQIHCHMLAFRLRGSSSIQVG